MGAGIEIELPKKVRVVVDGRVGRRLKLVHDWLPAGAVLAYALLQLQGQGRGAASGGGGAGADVGRPPQGAEPEPESLP